MESGDLCGFAAARGSLGDRSLPLASSENQHENDSFTNPYAGAELENGMTVDEIALNFDSANHLVYPKFGSADTAAPKAES